jgi:hypothetical protein
MLKNINNGMLYTGKDCNMNIVYKLTFNKRKERNIKPYFYIGSKSNCRIIDGNIIDKRGNIYYGSSTYDNYDEILKTDNISVEILGTFNTYNECIEYEKEKHLEYDVAASILYFNKSIATINNFTNPDYASYKHKETGEYIRLPKNHPLVLEGTYIGVTKGNVLSEERRKKCGLKGKNNPFYGKKHTEETIAILRKKSSEFRHSEETKSKMSEQRKGIPKSPEHRKKIGRKGLISLKNIITKEVVRIPKEQKNKYDDSIWVNLYKYKMMFDKTQVTCPHCGKIGNDNNSFRRWHNDNCRELIKK